METFNFCIRPNFTVNNEPRVDVVKFGEGYSQRSRRGINNLLRTYSVVVKVRNKERFLVDNFLARRSGVEPFYFLDPYTGEKKKVVCGKWPAKIGKAYTEFSCDFEEIP